MDNQNQVKKIAFFGTGLMGEPMAHRLLDAGYPLLVYNRTRSKTTQLHKKGAHVVSSPSEAMLQADVGLIMLADYPAIEEVLLQESCLSETWKGKTFIQMSTISPAESIQIKGKIEAAGGEYLEAPVLGSVPQVEAGILQILVGGTRIQYDRWDALFSCFGEKRYFIGPVGQAAGIKLALNQMGASQTAILSMSIGYLQETGVDVDIFMDILGNSAFHSPGFARKSECFKKRDFSTKRFPLKLLLKDVNLILEQFQGANIDASPLSGVQKVLLRAMEEGYGESDSLAVYNLFHPQKT